MSGLLLDKSKLFNQINKYKLIKNLQNKEYKLIICLKNYYGIDQMNFLVTFR